MSELADVAVIGAGVIGAALAAKLGRLGSRVLLIDGGLAGSGTTGATFAWFNDSSKVRLQYPPEYFELNKVALRHCYELSRQLEDGSWLHPIGNLEVVAADGASQLRVDITEMLARGYPVVLVDPRDASELEPTLSMPTGSIGAYYPHEGWIDGVRMVHALLQELRHLGGRVIESDAVVRLVVEKSRIVRAELASGTVVEAASFVLAAGISTQTLASQLDVTVPLVERSSPQVAGLLAHYEGGPNAATLHRIIQVNGAAVRPNGPGRLMVADIAGDSSLTPATPIEALTEKAEGVLYRAREALRVLQGFHFASAVIGIRALPVDRVSIVGWAPGVEGLYIAVTHSGMTLAAYIAELVASELIGGGQEEALGPFRPDRFVSPGPPTAALVH